MQAQLTGCFVLGRALPRTGESRSRGCSDTRAALPGFSAAFYSAPAFCTGQDGGRAASPSWLGKDTGDEADGCILLPGSRSSPGLVFLGDCGAYTALAPLQAPPRDPKAGVGSQTPEGSYGVGLSQLRSLWAASPEQGFLLLAAIFQALCCGCTNLEFGRSCRLLSGAFPRCSSENASREGKGLIVLLTCPCLNNAACKNIISIYTALLPACRPGPVIPYLTPLNRELWDAVGRDVLPQGGPPHQHCCWQIHLSPGQAGRSVLCWKCKARLMSKAGVCCAPLSARRMLVQNPPTQLSPSTGEHRLCPGQGAEEVLINGFVFPVAQQGEDHTPTLSMENSQTPLIRCAEKWPQTCHILSCIPSLQRLCSPAPVPAPHFGFPVPSTA